MIRRLGIVVIASSCIGMALGCSNDSEARDENPKEYKATISKVFEYAPAFGQFVNKLPVYEEGDTAEHMRVKAERALQNNEVITLGGFGGYVVFGFDHTIANVPGKRDFQILGNAFANNAEPGVILVAYDVNKNGKPDEDEWFEIAGSEHDKAILGYEITYYRPTKASDLSKEEIEHYIQWSDNKGNRGWKKKNTFHNQSYYPQWIQEETLTFKGTLLPSNAIKKDDTEKGWQLKAFEWGYADNYPNRQEGSKIDIDWAVDRMGNKVNLPGVDFIKVYTGLNQEAGWLGETSTEVAGAIDLHGEEQK
ncbi:MULTISPECIES: PKD domain-containing protein [unclassified Myroides]|uniref:PKD domain-containing protein n=1 Tax=unclassified Myroides TaxID=2642485 RepID=UPI003D2F7885